jgi:hypothetical protein
MDKARMMEELRTLRESCMEGLTGEWDCSTAEGREAFMPMIEGIDRLMADLAPAVGRYLVIGEHDATGEVHASLVPAPSPQEAMSALAREKRNTDMTLFGAVDLETGTLVAPCEDSGRSCHIGDYPVGEGENRFFDDWSLDEGNAP